MRFSRIIYNVELLRQSFRVPPFLPSTTCVCQRHRRETAALRGRLCPPPLSAQTSPPGKTHTYTSRDLSTHPLWDSISSDLVPEGDLPGVPARNPGGEQSFHVAQEHHPVYPVVLAAGLLVEAEMGRILMYIVCLYLHQSVLEI